MDEEVDDTSFIAEDDDSMIYDSPATRKKVIN